MCSGAQNEKSSAETGLNRRAAAYKPSEIPLIGGSSLRPDPMQTGVSCCELPVLAFGKHGGVRAKSVQISGLQHILHKRVEMKALTQSVLAAAMLMALPFASAEACNKNAWNGNTAAATGVIAAGPTTGQRAYSDSCSARAAPGQFVTDNTPNAETTYQARFYVYPGTGTGKIFSATTADANGGTEVVGVSYSGTAFTFSGATGVAPITAAPNAWYSVTLTHVSGGAFTVSVQGNGAASPTTGTGTSATASVGSASVGLIGTGTGTVDIDAFESTRSTTPIGRLCRGDTNADNLRNITDAIRTRGQFVSGGTTPAGGQPDINEDGAVNITDAIQIRNAFVSGQSACPAA